MIKLLILKALPDTESAFCSSLVIAPPHDFILACIFWSYIYF